MKSDRRVSAMPWRYAEAMANNRLAYPDPAIPTLNMPVPVVGILRVEVAGGRYGGYTRYLIGGVAVDPATILPA